LPASPNSVSSKAPGKPTVGDPSPYTPSSPELPVIRSAPPLPTSESFDGKPLMVSLAAVPMKVKKNAMTDAYLDRLRCGLRGPRRSHRRRRARDARG
jgi:hypothetical protein